MSKPFWYNLIPEQYAVATTPLVDIQVSQFTTMKGEARFRVSIVSKSGVVFDNIDSVTFADALALAMKQYNSMLWDEYERVRAAQASS